MLQGKITPTLESDRLRVESQIYHQPVLSMEIFLTLWSLNWMGFEVRPTRSGNLISVSVYKMDRSSYDLQGENQGNICEVSSIVPDIWQAFSKGTTIIASLISVSLLDRAIEEIIIQFML